MFGLQALRKLFNPSSAPTTADTSTLDDMIGRGSVAVISAACCDAMSTPKDEELAANLVAALDKASLQRPVAFGTLTGTRQQLRDAGSTLEGVALEFRNQLGALFQAEGLAAFPLLLVDGRIAFYGGVPSVDAIAQKLASALADQGPNA
jgi:hypothetical protein